MMLRAILCLYPVVPAFRIRFSSVPCFSFLPSAGIGSSIHAHVENSMPNSHGNIHCRWLMVSCRRVRFRMCADASYVLRAMHAHAGWGGWMAMGSRLGWSDCSFFLLMWMMFMACFPHGSAVFRRLKEKSANMRVFGVSRRHPMLWYRYQHRMVKIRKQTDNEMEWLKWQSRMKQRIPSPSESSAV